MPPLTLPQLAAPALPSASSALALIKGEPGALPLVIVHTTLRAGIIATGLYISGQRQSVLRTALISSLAIEAFVLGWAALAHMRQSRVEAVPPPRSPSPGI